MTDDTHTIAALRAALETAHWYSVDRTGRATQCVDAQDAHDNAACNARDWPAVAPHRAMQLIDAAPVAAMLAELDRLRDCLATANSQTEHFERQWYLRGDALEEMQAERDRLAAEVAEHQHAAQIIDAELGCQADGQNAGQTVDHIRAMAKEVAGLREDAERYRWLAAHARSTSEHWGGRWSLVIDGPAPKRDDCEDALDAAIDAAIDAASTATASEAKP